MGQCIGEVLNISPFALGVSDVSEVKHHSFPEADAEISFSKYSKANAEVIVTTSAEVEDIFYIVTDSGRY